MFQRWTFVIGAQQARDRFTGFVDMLRYDDCHIVESDPSMIVLQTMIQPPTIDRWISFGLHPLGVQTGDYPDISWSRKQAAERLP